jgi:transcriptional regulator with XRE-family HTH domain
VTERLDGSDDAAKQLDEERLRRLAGNVRAERARRGLTQPQLAGMLGLSKNTINAIENARTDPSYLTIWHLADALGVDLRDLVE